MPLKPLGQSKPGAGVLTDVYVVPPGSQAAISSVMVCEQAGGTTSFRIGVAPGGAADDPKHYFAFDVPITSNDVVDFTLGLTLSSGDVLRCYSAAGTLSFGVYGEELSYP